MIVGLGVDVFDVSRMERALREGKPDFGHDLFTPAEMASCASQHHPAEHYAACFAIKEAVFKALAVDNSDTEGSFWRDVELIEDAPGGASVVLHGHVREIADRRGVHRIIVSISHNKRVVVAGAVLES